MHSMKEFATCAAIAALLLSAQALAGPPINPPPGDAAGTLDTAIERRMEEAGIAGLGAAIIVDRKVAWMKGYGFADKERSVPFTSQTIMNIGSISKTFTGVALMRAVQEGKLSLDEDINRYLPFEVVNPSFPDERITLRQLATHTSTITDRWSVYERTYHYGGDSPESLGDFLRNYFATDGQDYSKDNFLDARPGTRREYSNIGAGLAGYIVELAAGEKLDAYTKRHIFEPLKMDDTGWFLSEVDPARYSKLYVAQGGITIPIPLYGGTTYPDGGVRTSVADLSKFFIALLNDGEYEGARILDKSTAREMLRFEFTESNKPDNISLQEKNSGIFWQSMFNVTRMGHGGSDPGIKTEMIADLSRQVGVVLFINTSLCDEGMRGYNAIFDDLWKHAETLKAAKSPTIGE
jgi:CubicO group peptidase (beta-lactamase class C family)